MKGIYLTESEGKSANADAFTSADENKVQDDAALIEMQKALAAEALKKEEDEFAKMEAMFIAELDLKAEQLPAFARSIVPITKPSK